MHRIIVGFCAAILAGGLIYQAQQIARLNGELEQLRAEMGSLERTPEGVRTAPAAGLSLGTLPSRVAQLEQNVSELAKLSEILSQRGIIPPSEDRIALIQQQFINPGASENERLRAFRLLRRNGGVTEDLVLNAIVWLQNSTNSNTRRAILSQLDGLTNASLRGPLLAMLGTETNGHVREEIVDTLSGFTGTPEVDDKIWEIALNDPNIEVREEAARALGRGSMTAERIAQMREKAGDANLPLDARLMALRALRQANENAPEVIGEMAQLAQNSPDPVLRAKLFDAFDGMNDPSLMVPLVYGLQDPNPVVRERAADALSTFASDPRIRGWLQHVINSDNDPRVKREAHRALERAQGRRTN